MSRDKTKKNEKGQSLRALKSFFRIVCHDNELRAKAYLDVLVRLRALFMSPLMGMPEPATVHMLEPTTVQLAAEHVTAKRQCVDHRRNSPKPNNLGSTGPHPDMVQKS